MASVEYVYWQDDADGRWLGYLREYSDYWTQGKTRGELEKNLADLYEDLKGGEISEVRRVGKLDVTSV